MRFSVTLTVIAASILSASCDSPDAATTTPPAASMAQPSPVGNSVPSDMERVQSIYSMDKEQAIPEVSKFAVGTWTSTVPGQWWYRLVVSPTGEASVQSVLPSADNWGNPDTGKLEVITDKDVGTGKRWYGFRVAVVLSSGEVNHNYIHCVILRNDARTVCGDAADPARLPFSRGDSFPFSK